MRPAFSIFVSDVAWSVIRFKDGVCQISVVEKSADHDLSAGAAAQALVVLGHRGEGILLGLPSKLCLCASVDGSGLRNRDRRSILPFRLEEQLPLAAEDLVADFLPADQRQLGVAVTTVAAEPIINAIERSGVAVSNVSPTALLIAELIFLDLSVRPGVHAILCGLDGNIDLVNLENGSAIAWTLLPADIATIEPHLRHLALGLTEPVRVHVVGVAPQVISALAKLPQIQLVDEPGWLPLELAASAANRILTKGSGPSIELRRGKLAANDPLRQVRTPLRAVVCALVALSISLAIGMFWRTSQYNRLEQAARIRQAESFHLALPRQLAPPSIASRLISEQKRLRGLSGIESALPPSVSILRIFHDMLTGLPQDLRFRVLELRVEPQRFYIEGQIRDHGDADQIAAALRRGTGFEVDSPHTEQPAGEDVTFTISAAASNSSPVPILAADNAEITQ